MTTRVLVAIPACAISCGFSVLAADEKPTPTQSPFTKSSSAADNAVSGELFRRSESVKFGAANKAGSFAELAWRFFAKQERLKPGDVVDLEAPETTGIIDFVAWSPDSTRLLVDLRGGDSHGDQKRGVYFWYGYFNTRTGQFELTDYLRKLNKGAWDRWRNFQPMKTWASFPQAASAEPLGELAPEGESKKRFDAADRRVKASFQKLLSMEEKQLQQPIQDEETSPTQRQIYEEQLKSTRDTQRDWLKIREMGAKLYADSGPKSTVARRYWQYMADSAEARANSLKEQIETEEN